MQDQLEDVTAGDRGPGSARLVVAGVFGACALGVGLGLWARPHDPDQPMAVAEAIDTPDPGPRRALQIVVDDAPAPIGPLLEVLPDDMAGTTRLAPGPAPFLPAPPIEPMVPRRAASGLVKVDAPVAAEPEPVPIVAVKLRIDAEAETAKADKARARKAELAAAKAARRKAEAAKVEQARADERRAEKARLAKAERAKAEKKRLAEAKAKTTKQTERKLAEKTSAKAKTSEKAGKPVKLAKAEAKPKREKSEKARKTEAKSKQLAKAKATAAKPKAQAKRAAKPKVQLAAAKPKAPAKKVIKPDRTTRVAKAAPPKKAVVPRGEGPMRIARANTCASDDPGEALVCADGRLGARDRQLQQAYRNAEASGVPASALRRQQARWLQARAAAAREAPWAVEDVYEARISELNDLSRDAREN